MTLILQNDHLRLQIDPDKSSWSLYNLHQDGACLEEATLRLAYRLSHTHREALTTWRPLLEFGPESLTSPQGLLQQLRLEIGPGLHGLAWVIRFGLPQDHPCLLWNVSLENRSPQAVWVDRLEMLRVKSGSVRLGSDRNWPDPAFFSNGWQSWSYAGVYSPSDTPRGTRLGIFRAPIDANAGTPRPSRAGNYASDMFGVLGDRRLRRAILAGFLSQLQHFGSLEARIASPQPDLRLWANGDGARLDAGQSMTTDWACLFFLDVDTPDPLGPYLDAVARQYGYDAEGWPSLDIANIPTGWCSWYQYSSSKYMGTISDSAVRQNLQVMAGIKPDIPLDLVQIDDGFQAQIGDWFEFTPRFPDGVKPLAAEIQAKGHTPGLWLAPFVVHPSSRLAKEHPDWLLRGQFNRPVNSGFLWNTFTTALDLTHPAALEHACEIVRTAAYDWGFPYLKLDFLYAAALPGAYHDPTRTRAQVMRRGLEALREAVGEQTFLLGCGAPLGSVIGLVNSMRIGADTARHWYPNFSPISRFVKNEFNFPSARNAIHNAITRAPLHRRWWINDPDCLLLRTQTGFNRDEVKTVAAVIALTGGSFLLSDDLTLLPTESLRIAQTLLPVIGKSAQIIDWFDASTPTRIRLDLENSTGAWTLLGLFNWEAEPRTLTLQPADFGLDPGTEYLAHDFWAATLYRIPESGLALPAIPAHGSVLLAVRPVSAGHPQYLGSDLHVSQGLEVSEWETGPEGVELCLERPGRAEGKIALGLPRPPAMASLNGAAIPWAACGEGCYQFLLQFEEKARLIIRF